MNFPTIIRLTDSYKFGHAGMCMPDTQGMHSYLEARTGSKFDEVVFYGLQYLIKEFLCVPMHAHAIYSSDAYVSQHMGAGVFPADCWKYIWREHNGKLPIEIRAVPEGTVVPVSNVMATVESTDPRIPWLGGFLETLLMHVWYPCTVATLSYTIKKKIRKFLERTSDLECVDPVLDFMLHDFGCRGATTMEAAALGGSAHLLNFMGTDTYPALDFISAYYHHHYYADAPYGYSVLATEHSIMTARGEAGEFEVVKYLLDKYRTGVLAMVIDSYDYIRFLKTCGTDFKESILSRDGRTVFRPDSGNVDIVSQKCLEVLGDLFGYEVNSKGYKVLHPKIRVLWGDGIDADGIENILSLSYSNGWAAENWVFGMGGGLLQKVNRDTCRFSFKCSAQKYGDTWHPVSKRSEDAFKASKAGRLVLLRDSAGTYRTEQLTPHNEGLSLLRPVYRNGELLADESFDTIRQRVRSSS